MRYQEPIYIQNQNNGVRNKDILNFNMSSELCIFEAPQFSVSGASKLQCGSDNSYYVINNETTIPLAFNFTGNTDSFIENDTTFSFKIYKYNENANIFTQPSKYSSENYSYETFSGTNILNVSVPINSLMLDGDYIVKGLFQYKPCTTFANKLDKTINTSSFVGGDMYGIYDSSLDYYFIAFTAAEKPLLLVNGSNTPSSGALFQQVLLPNNDETNLIITNSYNGYFVLTLNGLLLSPSLDYTFTGNVITLNSPTVKGDVVTITYTNIGGPNLIGDTIKISSSIVSGVTNSQGDNLVYYNTTKNKYEIYTSVVPADKNSIIVMLNGATLANNIDYYQSTSNPKRIILNGDLMVDDVLVIVYFPSVSPSGDLNTNFPTVAWSIKTPPTTTGGTFTLEVSNTSDFSSLIYTNSQSYSVDNTKYFDSFVASGSVGTSIYYRIKNQKKYKTICNDILSDTIYSDSIKLVVKTNAINSY